VTTMVNITFIHIIQWRDWLHIPIAMLLRKQSIIAILIFIDALRNLLI